MMDKENIVFTCNRRFVGLKKEGSCSICRHMNELGGHHAKSNKPDTRDQIVHDCTYTWNLQQSNT